MKESRNFSKSDKKRVIDIQKNKCKHCKKPFITGIREPHFDHIKPYNENGPSIISNCQALCPTCHDIKSKREKERKAQRQKLDKKTEGELKELAKEHYHYIIKNSKGKIMIIKREIRSLKKQNPEEKDFFKEVLLLRPIQ